jgi:hypothetical protein
MLKKPVDSITTKPIQHTSRHIREGLLCTDFKQTVIESFGSVFSCPEFTGKVFIATKKKDTSTCEKVTLKPLDVKGLHLHPMNDDSEVEYTCTQLMTIHRSNMQILTRWLRS